MFRLVEYSWLQAALSHGRNAWRRYNGGEFIAEGEISLLDGDRFAVGGREMGIKHSTFRTYRRSRQFPNVFEVPDSSHTYTFYINKTGDKESYEARIRKRGRFLGL